MRPPIPDQLFDPNDESDLIVASRSRIILDPPSHSALTEFQRVFLEDFYSSNRKLPGPMEMDYLTDHLNASRKTIGEWFRERHTDPREGASYRSQESERSPFSPPAAHQIPGYKAYTCPTCGSGFSTKGNMHKHIRMYHEGPSSSESRRPGFDDEPVTFESFKKYFDTEAVERDPQDYFSPPAPTLPAKGASKTKFTPEQRTELLAEFKR